MSYLRAAETLHRLAGSLKWAQRSSSFGGSLGVSASSRLSVRLAALRGVDECCGCCCGCGCYVGADTSDPPPPAAAKAATHRLTCAAPVPPFLCARRRHQTSVRPRRPSQSTPTTPNYERWRCSVSASTRPHIFASVIDFDPLSASCQLLGPSAIVSKAIRSN